jgi:hypothetical protein
MPFSSFARAVARRAAPAVLFSLLVAGSALAADVSSAAWHDVTPARLASDAPDVAHYRSLTLDVASVASSLAAARHSATAVSLSIPHPDGAFSDFLLTDSHVMPDALQDKFPRIASLVGRDAEGRRARVDISPLGLQVMVFEPGGVWIVRPETYGTGSRYMSFRRADLAMPDHAFQCGTQGSAIDPSGASLLSQPAPMTTTGATERTFRAAVAANHNYVAAVGGGTVEGGLAAVITAMNRVDEVYETELGVHMELIANEETIIYADADGDPYSNNGNALNQNQSNLDSVIGSANYDIGHVFTTGSGGVAGLEVTCINGQKARGTTGLGHPEGDGFYIDYVAHEMGHQFGGDHTFNSTAGSCGGGNRSAIAAYEPGSGSTIMAYAGICGDDDLQPHSDPYFHAKSLEEINGWIGSAGGACAVDAASDDIAPVIDTASLPGEVTIPIETPFALTASASDAHGDPITYNWEQYDRGAAHSLADGDTGTGPIFRSFNATTSGTRIFPQLSTVLGAELVPGETWATTTRDLTFRLTVRDNHDVPGTPQFGATTSANGILIHTTDTAGPFVVTRPNTALTWGRGETHEVTWDVAGTDAAPVSCANVAIDLSADGGETFAIQLVASTPNSGSASIVVPDVADTDEARVRVSCADSIFFDVSDVDFSIAPTGDPDPGNASASVSTTAFSFIVAGVGDSDSDTLTISNEGDASSTLDYTIAESGNACATTDDLPWLAASPTSGAIAGQSSTDVTVSVDSSPLTSGAYIGYLCLASNDVGHPTIVVEVSLTIGGDDWIFRDGFDGFQRTP